MKNLDNIVAIVILSGTMFCFGAAYSALEDLRSGKDSPAKIMTDRYLAEADRLDRLRQGEQ